MWLGKLSAIGFRTVLLGSFHSLSSALRTRSFNCFQRLLRKSRLVLVRNLAGGLAVFMRRAPCSSGHHRPVLQWTQRVSGSWVACAVSSRWRDFLRCRQQHGYTVVRRARVQVIGVPAARRRESRPLNPCAAGPWRAWAIAVQIADWNVFSQALLRRREVAHQRARCLDVRLPQQDDADADRGLCVAALNLVPLGMQIESARSVYGGLLERCAAIPSRRCGRRWRWVDASAASSPGQDQRKT